MNISDPQTIQKTLFNSLTFSFNPTHAKCDCDAKKHCFIWRHECGQRNMLLLSMSHIYRLIYARSSDAIEGFEDNI